MTNIIYQENYYNYNIIEYDIVNSTMNTIKNFKENTIVLTKNQTSGRGKGHRKWSTGGNNNLYFSLLLKADNTKLDYSQLSFVFSIAVRESIKKFDKYNNVILSKWPNDVLINNKKTCGILLEFDRLNQNLIIGCGINIDFFPEIAMFKATSLENENIIIDRYDFLKEIINNFDCLFNLWKKTGFKKIREIWLESAYKINETVIVDNKEGIFKDLDEDGTLILKLNNNESFLVKSGDVF